MHISVTNETKGVALAPQARAASSAWSRLRGLLGTNALQPGEGLWLTPCTSVHTFFMRYTIDVAFLDAQGVVLAKATLVPWRFSAWNPKAAGVLELPAGTLERTRTAVGDRLNIKPH